MKIAIVCDWLVTIGGAEKFLGHLLRCYPQADLFSVVDFVDNENRNLFIGKTSTTTFIQHLPFAKKYYRHYLPLMPIAIEQLDLSAYSLIISSSHAVAKGVLTGPDQLHIAYVHSPMRYAWDLQHQYLQETGLDKAIRGWIARYLLHKLRLWDVGRANGVDHFLANSHFIARRIQKTYRRDATVLYPPVELGHFKPHAHKENFYLAASRLVPYKKMDLIVESFSQLPDKKLIVIGDGPDYAKIKKKCPTNVSMLGFQSNATLLHYLQRAKALLFAAEEDFGLVPLEAQACGTPVIAFGKGGARETVRDISEPNPTGVFFDSQTTASIVRAINTFENSESLINPEDCIAHAKKFSPLSFQTQFKKFVTEKWQAHLLMQQNG